MEGNYSQLINLNIFITIQIINRTLASLTTYSSIVNTDKNEWKGKWVGNSNQASADEMGCFIYIQSFGTANPSGFPTPLSQLSAYST